MPAEPGDQQLLDQAVDAIKTRPGVRPKQVPLLPPDTLPCNTQKAERMVDRRGRG